MRQLQDFRLHYYNECRNVMVTAVYGDGTTAAKEISLFDAVELSLYAYSGKTKKAANKVEELLR